MSNDNEDSKKKIKIIDSLIPKKTEDLIKQAETSLNENRFRVKQEILKINNLVKKKIFFK